MTIHTMNEHAITNITIHCAATPEGRAHAASEISQWDIQRFGQPSYHYVIELTGNVVQTLNHNQVGAHVGGHNTGNIGICYVGGVDARNQPKDTRTPAQKIAMEQLVRRLAGIWPNAKIKGHRDWPNVNKACPSFDVHAWLTSFGFGAKFG